MHFFLLLHLHVLLSVIYLDIISVIISVG